jgi:DNA-binding Lrp family transcriptional regulator
MTDTQGVKLDEIDSVILTILASDPRAPYTDIAAKLEEEGYEMSSEGIRYRVRKLMEVTTTFFFIDLERVSGEIVRVAVDATDDEGAKRRTFEAISRMQFWHVTRGVGTYDVYAVGIASTLRDTDELLTDVRELDSVERVRHIVATERSSSIEDYLAAFQADGDEVDTVVDAGAGSASGAADDPD